MTSDQTDSTAVSLSMNFGSKTKELCSFCKERPYDLVCQCGDKFDFNCIGNHVEAINFEYNDVHVATGKELAKLESAKRSVRSNAYRDVIDNWVRLRTQDIQDIAEAAKSGFRTNEQIGTETTELAELYAKLHEIQDQSVHDRLTFIVELQERIKGMQVKLQTVLSSTAEYSQLDESLRAKLSSSKSATVSGDSPSLTNDFDEIPDDINPKLNEFLSRRENSSAPGGRASSERFAPTFSATSRDSVERPLANGFERHDPPTPEPAREEPRIDLARRTELTFATSHSPARVEATFDGPPSPARVEATFDEPPSPARVEATFDEPPSPTPTLIRVEVPPAASTTHVEPKRPTASPVIREVPAVVKTIPTFEPPSPLTPTYNPPVEPPKPAAKPEVPATEFADSGSSDEFDAGLSKHISRRLYKNIPAINDRNAGTLCSHNDQLVYVDYDEANKKPQVIFLHNVEQPEDKLIMDWIPSSETGSSGGDEDWIRDITYCTRHETFMLVTQTCIHTWNDVDDRFKEYHRLAGRQLKRITTDQHFIYLISASGRMTARGDTIIFLSYDKDEVSKAFTDIIPSRMNRGTAPLNGEITDIAVAPRDQLMITYRIERRSEVGICLFQVGNRGRDWSCVKQLQLNECWHASLTYTPRVEWSHKLNVFILIEYMTGHLLMIGQDGHVKGECRFTHNDGKSESPINLTISNRDWLCTRYDSVIVVKKLE